MKQPVEFQHMFGYARLESFPGNEDIAVSVRCKVREGLRGNGFGKTYHAERLRDAYYAGLSYITCTVRMDNPGQIHILEEYGWKKLDEFKSRRTGHTVGLYGRHIG